jgi:general L-amino acid transport system permease protein
MTMSESQVPQDEGKVYTPGQHPDLPPPAGTVGVIGWLRGNLFSGPVNTVATLITLFVLYSVVVPVANWAVFDAVVSGQSRQLCDLGRSAALVGEQMRALDPENLALDPEAPGLSEEAAAQASIDRQVAQNTFASAASALGTFIQRFEAAPPELVPERLPQIVQQVQPREILPELEAAVDASDYQAAQPLFQRLEPLAEWGDSYDGACWVVVKQRWVLFMTGFYDREENWRPLLAGIGLILAVAPLLFTGMPYRKPLLYWSAAYPFVAYYLLTGVNLAASPIQLALGALLLAGAGAIVWGKGIANRQRLLPFAYAAPALVVLVLFAGSLDRGPIAFDPVVENVDANAGMAAEREGVEEGDRIEVAGSWAAQFFGGKLFVLGIGLAPIWWLIALAVFALGLREVLRHAAGKAAEAEWRAWSPVVAMCSVVAALLLFFGGQSVYEGVVLIVESTDKWGGLLATLVSGIVGITASLPIGILLALGRRSKMPAVRMICVSFIELIRGVPLITILFMSSVMLPLFLPEGVNFDKFLRALIGVALFASAYMAEVVRGGLQAIPKGQYEAADALGLNWGKSMRLIILPQALKIVIPGIVNTFIGLFKDTTLLGIIGILDLLQVAKSTNSDADWIGFFQETYAFVGILFFIFCFGMSRYSIYLEGKLETGHKRR